MTGDLSYAIIVVQRVVSPDCPDKGRSYQAASAEVGDRRDMAQRSVSFARGPEYPEDEQRDYYGRGRRRSRGSTE